MGVFKLSDYEDRRQKGSAELGQDPAKLLDECRDLAIHRLLLSFTAMLDRLTTLLFEQAEKSVRHDDVNLFLAARTLIQKERARVAGEFERALRTGVDDGIKSGGKGVQADYEWNADNLSLVDSDEIEQGVAMGKLAHTIEEVCQEQFSAFNQRVGYLLGNEELDQAKNPLSPQAICRAFKDAFQALQADTEIKLAVLRQLNQNILGDINSIYADLNRHLVNAQVLPTLRPMLRRNPRQGMKSAAAAAMAAGAQAGDQAAAGGGDFAEGDDVFATLQFLLSRMQARAGSPGAGIGGGMPGAMGSPGGAGMSPGASAGAAAGPMTAAQAQQAMLSMLDSLTQLQHGNGHFVMPNGAALDLDLPLNGDRNILREISSSGVATLGHVDAMTIELVAMLFDYIYEDKNLAPAIKALLGRLQIPVLKASMLDKAFFSKRSHPARRLVDRLAEAGIGWTTEAGTDDALFRAIEGVIHRIQDEFVDQVEIFARELEAFEGFLETEEKAAEALVESSAEELHQRDRSEIARLVALAEIDRRAAPGALEIMPDFLLSFLRERWVAPMQQAHFREGEDGQAWQKAVQTMDDLIWSVQPKRSIDDRKRLVSLLPGLLQRLYSGLQGIEWEPAAREAFLSQLVDAHAGAVKASLHQMPAGAPVGAVLAQGVPTLVSVATVANPTIAPAGGGVSPTVTAVAPAAFGGGIPETVAAVAPASAPAPSLTEATIAAERERASAARRPEAGSASRMVASLVRGSWIEFANDKNVWVRSKLAWVSPLRGNYLFTNRQGYKALAVSRDELIERFRGNRARLVDVEPLMDRAIFSMMETLNEQVAVPA